MGIRDRPTAPRSPWQNGHVERLIGSIRRECLDHLIIFGEAYLRRVLHDYANYYNGTRTHLSPGQRRSTPSRDPTRRPDPIRPSSRRSAPFLGPGLIFGRDRHLAEVRLMRNNLTETGPDIEIDRTLTATAKIEAQNEISIATPDDDRDTRLRFVRNMAQRPGLTRHSPHPDD